MSDTGYWPYGKDYAERERVGNRADAILKEMVDEAMSNGWRLAAALRDTEFDDLLAIIVAAIGQNSIGSLHNNTENLLRLMWRDQAQRQAEGGG